ncbi:MAG: hypothetical protein M1838_003915 [Thelocarpon superellum]|nr:MAG: hypothetical protein M1838_003915 [Thelocarpon superellum]
MKLETLWSMTFIAVLTLPRFGCGQVQPQATALTSILKTSKPVQLLDKQDASDASDAVPGEKSSGKRVMFLLQDGVIRTDYGDGETKVTQADGTTEHHYPDGSTVTVSEDGRTRTITNTDGSKTTTTTEPERSVSLKRFQNPDGSYNFRVVVGYARTSKGRVTQNLLEIEWVYGDHGPVVYVGINRPSFSALTVPRDLAAKSAYERALKEKWVAENDRILSMQDGYIMEALAAARGQNGAGITDVSFTKALLERFLGQLPDVAQKQFDGVQEGSSTKAPYVRIDSWIGGPNGPKGSKGVSRPTISTTSVWDLSAWEPKEVAPVAPVEVDPAEVASAWEPKEVAPVAPVEVDPAEVAKGIGNVGNRAPNPISA